MAGPVNKIRHVGGVEQNAYTYYPVLVIGAGESGIAMGCRLKQVLGCDQFRIFERRSSLGGTWFTNQYPGIACDIPAIMYSYSFAQNPKWTALYPSGREIVQYLYDVCERFEILDKIQLNTGVTAIKWVDEDEEWEVTLAHMVPGAGELTSAERKHLEATKGPEAVVLRHETVRAKVVCSAVGGLLEPREQPKVPGLDSFEGQVMHTARWDPSINLRDKDVVLLGTGCSAAQVLPELVSPSIGVRSVTQLLRSPPWTLTLLPGKAREWWHANMPFYCRYVPGFQNFVRKTMFAASELQFLELFTNSERARRARQTTAAGLLKHMQRVVPEKYHEILTPDYELFCKRRVMDEGWFETLQKPNVEITSLPLTAVHARSVTLGPGRHYPPMSKTNSTAPTEEKTIPADVIILANGYETGQWLHPLDVTGRDGRSLYKTWDERGGAQAYLGTAMDGFPNFFLIFGPNTATGHSSVILASENMVNYALKFIRPILAGDVSTYEVKESAERKWTNDLQRQLKDTVFMAGGCTSWYYQRDNGWNATVYPRTQVDFTLRCMFPVWRDWDVKWTRKGMVKMRLRQILAVLTVLAGMLGLVYTLRDGGASTRERVRDVVAAAVGAVRGYLRYGLDVLRERV